MKIKLLSITPDAEKIIELAGRTAYNSIDKITENSHEKFITNLISRGHESVLEHASASFLISDISRATSHQLVRHRLCSFTQRSQRYTSEKNFEYVIPELIENDERALKRFLNLMERIRNDYEYLHSLGIKNEDCRSILPNACTTKIIITTNFREFRHIIKLRINKSAQLEIQNVCKEILKILKSFSPTCFYDLEV
jgi:thymidylate synthase (FAD)